MRCLCVVRTFIGECLFQKKKITQCYVMHMIKVLAHISLFQQRQARLLHLGHLFGLPCRVPQALLAFLPSYFQRSMTVFQEGPGDRTETQDISTAAS